MSLRDFAREELTSAGLFDKDSDYNGMLGESVMRLIETFAAEGHSGMSASLALQAFTTLANGNPLTPLTGADDEWTDVSDGLLQNRRCSHVFKGANGAYDIDGIIFRDPDGSTVTNGDSRVPVTFPYTPQSIVVDRV